MDVNGLNKLQNTDYLSKVTDTASAAAAKTNTAKTDTSSAEGVIYDKSSSTTTGTDYKTNNAALIQKLKQDSEDRINQLKDIVSQMMTKQGIAIGTADDMWSFLAKGDFEVDAETKAQAQADIAEDGYWGV